MSDEKEARPRRTTPAAKPTPEPVAEAATATDVTTATEAATATAETLPAAVTTIAALPAPVVGRAPFGAERLLNAYRATFASIGASQTAIASDIAAMALEIGGLARANATEAGDSFTALIGAKSLVDAVEIQLGFARRSLDMLVGGSTRLSEIGLRLANEAAKPALAPFSAR